jgi:NAD-dependent deacetylase sirtuin 4
MRVRRNVFQRILTELNGTLFAELCAPGMEAAPDGDAELEVNLQNFRVPSCDCGGIMKPDVVFFGENVPRDVVNQAWGLFEHGDALLVIGSSLEVYSGRRFVDRAQRDSIPIAIVNLGATRADHLATLKIEAASGDVLPRLAESLLLHAKAR